MKLQTVLIGLFAVCNANNIHKLTDDNFGKIFEGSWLIMFYAPWCPACQSLKSPWEQFASKNLKDDLQIHVAEVDVTQYPALSGQFLIFNLPSIYYIQNGESRQYVGQLDISAVESWITDGKWRETEAVASWRSPNSFIMRSVGKFFHFANQMRVLKNEMTEHYAIPSWIVYTIFIISTIIIGLLVGLVLVCLCDCLCPPKSHQYEMKPEGEENEVIDEEEDDDGEEDGEEDGEDEEEEDKDAEEEEENTEDEKRRVGEEGEEEESGQEEEAKDGEDKEEEDDQKEEGEEKDEKGEQDDQKEDGKDTEGGKTEEDEETTQEQMQEGAIDNLAAGDDQQLRKRKNVGNM
ncbi:thioredoxin-related transmembrane protein 1-like [Watersipora subatra]|uniref:thioredoxin-related transmembrane protein 1-like n=1 Tax=Watersipora subatra TaxID=2589382 RepID=UPI00355AEF4E